MKTRTIDKECIICGDTFKVELDKDNKILTDCFYMRMPKYYFLGWTYSFDGTINFRNLFWRIVGFSKISREIIYFIIKHTYERIKIEYWECTECSKE